jgi:hypothetical protein
VLLDGAPLEDALDAGDVLVDAVAAEPRLDHLLAQGLKPQRVKLIC